MAFWIDDKQLEKYKAIWTKVEDLKNIEWNALQVYDYRYIKTKIATCVNKVYTNFRSLNVPEGDVYRMWIFYSHFYWFFTCICKQILPASIFRQLHL